MVLWGKAGGYEVIPHLEVEVMNAQMFLNHTAACYLIFMVSHYCNYLNGKERENWYGF